uniref:SAM domain-containing protein n=6 Tax=Boreoeutheria TaxID=1437010 RepID=A0A9L0RWD9_HORSE
MSCSVLNESLAPRESRASSHSTCFERGFNFICKCLLSRQGVPIQMKAAQSVSSSSLVAEVKEPCSLPMLSVDMENKENGSVGVKNSMENGRPPDPADWAVMDVVNYFRTAGFEEQASAFQEQEIDGKSLLLMTRNDVLTGLQLKLGPALKIYEYHVKPLQTKHLKNSSS